MTPTKEERDHALLLEAIQTFRELLQGAFKHGKADEGLETLLECAADFEARAVRVRRLHAVLTAVLNGANLDAVPDFAFRFNAADFTEDPDAG